MLDVIRNSWALYTGILLLMMGNSLQGTLVGVRAEIEGFDPQIFGFVSSAYFAGLMIGARMTPILLKRVGHVRVFAALASLISAAFIIYAAVVDPITWLLCRLVIGVGFAGIYIVSESWINDLSDNENRGSALGVYMLIQMGGVMVGQGMLNLGDPASFELFVLMSVLVSVSFAPILLSVQPAPVFETAKPMTLRELYVASPLGSIGMLILGGTMAAMFGMGALYATTIGMTIPEISIFLAAFYGGALASQYPIGWLSDRMDRRVLIVIVCLLGGVACIPALLAPSLSFGQIGDIRILALFFAALVVGGLAHPAYGLLVAHTNDFLEKEQMAAAAGGLLFMNGVGAAISPIIVGYMFEALGPEAFWFYICGLLFGVAAYGTFRMTQRPTVDDTAPYQAVTSRMGAVGLEIAQELVIEQIEAVEAENDAEDQHGEGSGDDDGNGGGDGTKDPNPDRAPIPS